jgi:hypothetical protein
MDVILLGTVKDGSSYDELCDSVSMVVILLGTVKDGSSYDELCDCEHGGDSFRYRKGWVIL